MISFWLFLLSTFELRVWVLAHLLSCSRLWFICPCLQCLYLPVASVEGGSGWMGLGLYYVVFMVFVSWGGIYLFLSVYGWIEGGWDGCGISLMGVALSPLLFPSRVWLIPVSCLLSCSDLVWEWIFGYLKILFHLMMKASFDSIPARCPLLSQRYSTATGPR